MAINNNSVVNQHQRSIFLAVKPIILLPGHSIEKIEEYNKFKVTNIRQFVQDYLFCYDIVKEQYRVYIYIASSDTLEKKNAGYCFMTVANPLAANDFLMMVRLLFKNRANKQ